jgi:DNA-binding HxlR family transcriptional regulator
VAEGRARGYGQYCGLARAAELVGERWALLIVRDLLVGPRRFTDLRHGLPRIPTNILSERLKELEDNGIARRRVLPRPAAAVVYELTPYGQQLEEVVMQLGLWGAQSLGEPRPDEIITSDSIVMALRSTFRPEPARGLRAGYELRLGDIVVYARVEDGTLTAGRGSLPDADVVLESGPAIRSIMAGEVSPAEALENGSVRLSGSPELFAQFAELFQIPQRPPAT